MYRFVFYQFIYLAPRVVYQRLGSLSPALTSHLDSPHAWTQLPPALPSYTCAWIYDHLRTHLAASQKHNNQLGATSPLTPPRVACGTLGDAVLSTPKRVCGASRLPSRLSGATHLSALRRVFLVIPTACQPCACVFPYHSPARQHAQPKCHLSETTCIHGFSPTTRFLDA